MWYWHGMGPWGWLLMIAFWAVATFLIFWTVRSTATARQEEDSPLRILDERLARGEIDREDYEERRRVLQAHRLSSGFNPLRFRLRSARGRLDGVIREAVADARVDDPDTRPRRPVPPPSRGGRRG